MIINYADVIEDIRKKYKEDEDLQSMIDDLENICDAMKNALKDHELIYTISDYTDEELRNLDCEVVCDLCQYEIYKLISIYDKMASCIDFKGYCTFTSDGKFSIGYIYKYSTADPSSDYDGFDVTIEELRNPELYRIRREKEIEERNKVKREREIAVLERKLTILKNSN